MKIAVIAANGRAGSLIVKEAIGRGMDVTAIVKDENRTEASNTLMRDLMDLTAEDLQGFDAVVDAFGVFDENMLSMHTTTSQHLCDILKGSSTRLLIIGGAGSLYLDKSHNTQLFETPDFPADYLPLAKAQAAELAELRKRDDVRWTFVSPAADFRFEEPRTGKYILGGEELTLNSRNESIISYADYAVAMVDEIESGNHIRQRISVVRK